MTLRRQYARTLRRNAGFHPAWLPIAAPLGLGDYGLWDGGVFVKRGNVREFGVDLASEAGPPAQFNFVSERKTSIAFVGEQQVAALPDTEEAATLKVTFSEASSFVLKAGRIECTQVPNVDELALRLRSAKRLSDGSRWRARWKIVWQTYQGHDVTLLSTRSANTTITVSGKAKLIRRFVDLGFSAGLELAWDNEVGLDLVGSSGIVGLGLFRSRIIGGPVSFESTAARGLAEIENRWEDDPEDDL